MADHHVNAMKSACIGARSHNGVADLLPTPTPLRAALTFAGNTRMKKAISAIPAAIRMDGTRRPTAPANSQTPVKYTIARGQGTQPGTIRTKSSFILVNL